MHSNQVPSPVHPHLTDHNDLRVKKWLLSTCRSLADHPEDVGLTAIPTHNGVLYELRCAQADLRRIIGRGGKTADSIRNLMSCFSGKSGRKYRLDIIES